MKKRLIGTLLLGALLVSSTSMFVSCKDYDDDINNIVATKADRTELQQAKQDLENKISGLTSELAIQKGRIDALTSELSDLTATVATKADKAPYQGKMFNLIDEIERAVAAEAALAARIETAEGTIQLINETLEKKLDKTEFNEKVQEIYGRLESISTDLGIHLTRIEGLEKGLKDTALAVRATISDHYQQIKALQLFQQEFNNTYKPQILDATKNIGIIMADYLKDADKKELENKIAAVNARVNSTNARIDSLNKVLNAFIEKVNGDITTIKGRLDAHDGLLEGLRRDVNNNYDAIVKLQADVIALNVLINESLRSLVFRPESYYMGIEAMTIHVLDCYKYRWNDADGIPAATASDPEKRGYVGKDPADLTKVNVSRQTHATTNAATTGRYDSLNVFFVLPTQATYHMNPSSANLSKVTKVAIIDGDKKYLTRASEAVLFCDENIASHDWQSEFGILKVNLDANDISKVKSIAADGKVTVFATQVTLLDDTTPNAKDTTITSDYAAVVRDTIKDLRLTHINIPTLEGNNNTAILNAHCGKCALDVTANRKSHLMATVNEAAYFAPQDSVNWNSTIDLSTIIATHYTTTSGRHDALTAEEMEKYGLSYKYELTEYKKGANETEESVQAALNGSILRPQVPTRDGQQQAYGADQDRNTIGRTPIVRVSLMKGDKVLDYGYIRLVITEQKTTIPQKEPVSIEYVGPAYNYKYSYECQFQAPTYAFGTTWSITQHDIYAVLMNSVGTGTISREEFEYYYTQQGDANAVPEKYGNSNLNLKQYKVTVVDGKKVFTEIAIANKVGTVSSEPDPDAENGTTTHTLTWALTSVEAEATLVDVAGKKAKETDYVNNGIAVKYISKDKTVTPDFYVIFKPGAITVTFNEPSGVVDFGNKKIDQYWFSANSIKANGTEDAGEDEIHVNVYSPEDQRGKDRYGNGRTDATDVNELKISSTLEGNDAKGIITVSGDETEGKEYAADKLYLKFIFDASNNGKEYKGVDGNTYVISVKNDTILQANIKGQITKQDIAYLKHDKTVIAPANVKDSINHQKIVYNFDPVNGTFAQALLNYKGRFERDANTITAIIGVKAKNACRDLKLTQSTFNVRFDRPINVYDVENDGIQDAGNGGEQIIYLRDVIRLTDWRNTPFREFDGVDYWKYYNIKSIKIDGVPDGTTNVAPYVKTTLNESKRDADKKWATLSDVTEDLILTYDVKAPAEPKYGLNTDWTTIKYQNLSGSVGNFQLKLPIRVEYEWGYVLTTEVIVDVLDTQSSRRK